MPTISVIIPVYKAESYLPRCIESVLSQTFSDFELILVEDGSPDNSGAICDRYAQTDSRIHIIHKPNGGVSAARNDGIAAATGKYITFIDSDDYIDPDFFETALLEITQHGADLYISGIQMDSYNGELLVSSMDYGIQHHSILSVKELMELARSEYPLICICGPCCKLYAAELIRNADMRFDTAMSCGEDTDFNLTYLSHANNIVFSDQIFYHYCRSNTDSLFSRFHPETYEIHTAVYDKMRQLMRSLDCCSDAMIWFENYYFSLLVGGIHEYYRFYQKTSPKEKYNLIKKVGQNEHIHAVTTPRLSRRNRLFYMLLRRKMYTVVQLFFFLHYRVIKRNKDGVCS